MNNSTGYNQKYALPEGWRWVKLGEVCDVISKGATPTTYGYDFVNSGIPFLRAEDIIGGPVDLSSVAHHITEETHEFLDRSKLRSEDILITIAGTLGRVGYLPEGVLEVNCNQAVAFARVDSTRADVKFLCYFLQIPEVLSPFVELKVGGTIQNLNLQQVRSIEIPLPPLFEQRRITAKLQELMQEVRRARTAGEKQLEAAKALPAAYLREVFQSEEAKKWERKRLGEVCEYSSGIWGDEPDGSPKCYFVLRSNNIKNAKIVFDEIAIRKVESKYLVNKSLKFGDILVTTSSGSKDLLGKSAIFIPPDDKIYLFSNFTMRLRAISESIDCFYLYFYLQSPRAKEVVQLIQDTTTGLRNLDRKEFSNQSVPLPPIEEQKRIAAKLKEKMVEVDKLRTSIEKQLEAINALPQAILRKAFRGEL
jgi:restriction endonuclease S subunit